MRKRKKDKIRKRFREALYEGDKKEIKEMERIKKRIWKMIIRRIKNN